MAENQPGTSRTPAPSSMSSSGSFMSDFQTQVQYQMFQLQRMVQEIRNTSGVDKSNVQLLQQELTGTKDKMKTMEGKLGNLQRVVANQADSGNNVKKEMTDNDNNAKGQMEALKLELGAMKESMQNSARIIEEVRRSGGGIGGGNLAIPANLTQMFEALERQLGMYDVKIAENDVRFQVLETTSYTGKLLWKIRDFNRRREDAKKGKTLSIYSQPFYTSRYGYKMCLRIYLNGDGMGKNTHISLFFVLMKGDYDNLLPFPFRQKVTLMLLDQGADRRHLSDVFRPDPTSSSFKKPSSDMNIASGCPMFVSHEILNGSSYMLEDTIFVKVIVDTTDLENY